MSKTRIWTRAIAATAALCAALLAGGAVRAEDGSEPRAADAALTDPPGRVGRVSALVGAVDLSQGTGAPWELARINQPVTGQTALFAPPGSQAEVRIGSASVRLDADTQAVFSQLDDHGIAIDVAQGTVRARVRNLPTGDAFSLAADGVRAEAEQPGDYRVSYDPDNRAYTVRTIAGELRLVTPSGSYRLEAGQEIVVEDGGETVRLRPPGPRDAFDAWAEARDSHQDALASARYVSPETTGIEALDEHGSWDMSDEYGAVWYPRSLPSGWAPYRYGHWAHVHPWGWTWVDDAPWGFAPFHYGRWALVGSRWGWVPGPIVERPVWAPALVGYVGGSRLSIGIGLGAPVGWFPLGPHEIYHPTYRYSQRHWDHVNWRKKHRGDHDDWHSKHRRGHDDWHGKHRRDRDEWRDDDREHGDRRMRHHGDYRYAKRADALTVVSADSFRGSRAVASERLPLDAGQIAQLAPLSPGLRLPDTTPKLGNTAAFGSRSGASPALHLPAPPSRGLRERDGDNGRREGRARRGRDADGDRRIMARPPGEERVGTGRRADSGMRRDVQPPVLRGARADRDPLEVIRPQPGRPAYESRPAPNPARNPAAGTTPRGEVQAVRGLGTSRALRPQPPSAVRPVLPAPPVRRLERPATPARAIAPERRMQAPPVQRQVPPRTFSPVRPAPALPARSHTVQPPMQAVPGLAPRHVQGPGNAAALRRAEPTPRVGAGRGERGERGMRGGRVEAPPGARRQR